MSGIYLKCDTCGADFPPHKHELSGCHWSNEPALRAGATEAGWSCYKTQFNSIDKCPDCIARAKEAGCIL